MNNKSNKLYDVFLSHSHKDAEYVETLAARLEDEYNIRVWLDKWILIPGKPFRQELASGLETAKTCAVFIGRETPRGWFNEEISKALKIQISQNNFRVIPVLLPDSDESFITDFLELRTYVDFRKGINSKRKFHELICGIKGIQPGRKYIKPNSTYNNPELKTKLKQINELFEENIIDESLKFEFHRVLIQEHIISRKNEK